MRVIQGRETTVARLIAKYLKVLGYLSSGHLVEAGREKLVGEYIGHTAPKTQAVLEAAKGGVLFIDEAYSLARGNTNDFGKEAVDTLVKGMDDYRDDLVVIMAGYTNEMEDLLKMNPGLRSRINHTIEFNDYSPEEMLQIAQFTAESKGYIISTDCENGLKGVFEKRQIPGKNDAGNGRLARNIVETAIQKQASRFMSYKTLEEIDPVVRNTLTRKDFELEDNSFFDLEQQLEGIIGLEEIKQFVRQLERQLVAKDKRKSAGIETNMVQSLHLTFTGNPGTGKTTIARAISNLFRQMGILKSGQIIETDRSGLVAEYVGQTSSKTRDVFMSALGGILIIDEAYSLSSDDFGKEAINTLVKLMEDHRENIVVILAGYSKEMRDFLKTNSGLKSRFPRIVDFPDYSVQELVEIGKKMIRDGGYNLTAESEQAMLEMIKKEQRFATPETGNGRLIRDLLEKAVLNQNDRVALSDVDDKEGLMLLQSSDFIFHEESSTELFQLDKKLDSIIGLTNVKEFILSLKAQVMLQKERKKHGLPIDSTGSLHMLFTGNPGTGKTTMARVVGELFYDLGILPQKKFVEVDRSDLVAGYVGQTALKTKEKIEEAMGGILFVDEAYALASDAESSSSFGKEAIETILKAMEDYREQLIVIFAGYTNEMETFLKVNPGLTSRLPNVIEFPDYTVEELLSMAEKLFKQNGYNLTAGAVDRLTESIMKAKEKQAFDNGRFIRNQYEETVPRNMALRLQYSDMLNPSTLTLSDS